MAISSGWSLKIGILTEAGELFLEMLSQPLKLFLFIFIYLLCRKNCKNDKAIQIFM